MNLTRALKEKNRLVKKITTVRNQIVTSNVSLKENPFPYNMEILQNNYSVLIDTLIDMKVAIQIANQPILKKIYALSELKSAVAMLHHLDTKEGMQETDGYGASELREYEVQISRSQLDSRVEDLQTEIDALQDKIDEFNATTTIDFDLPDLKAISRAQKLAGIK